MSPLSSPSLSSRSPPQILKPDGTVKPHHLPSLSPDSDSTDTASRSAVAANTRLRAPHLRHRRSNSDQCATAGRLSNVPRGFNKDKRRSTLRAADDSNIVTRPSMRVAEDALRAAVSMPPSKFRDSIQKQSARVEEPAFVSPSGGDGTAASKPPIKLDGPRPRSQLRKVCPLFECRTFSW